MYFILLLMVFLAAVLVAAAAFDSVLQVLERSRNLFGSILAVCHLVLVAWIVYLIFKGNEPDWPMYWLLFIAVDFPASLLWLGAAFVLPHFPPCHFSAQPGSPLNDPNNFLLPLFFTAVVGTAWWFFLPRVIAAVVRFFRSMCSRDRAAV